MAEYRFHWKPPGTEPARTEIVTLRAASPRHGAALALRQFVQLGCDLTAPLAHIDITEADGVEQMLLVEEVLDWLNDPKQIDFLRRERLAVLLTAAQRSKVLP